eukprot:CAMPEP_0204565406 /NCGR_PEP_ID=MMETSP0661-20131031/35456_1 /ASSEMBLY_ACC=CAM_ASM_000606 /TAXON_ID=109239 /ORGANISM="Alexandrium margalefi, Strain AMGDE01CS-322" /LENGTH=207 /DNA_ID=CAMNT_0051573153 /DNA_START=60 /DNA_END=681 /DNA_ORIENTATION=-
MHLPIDDGTPLSSFQLEQGRYVKATLLVQTVFCVMRMVALWDILGGFMMALTIALGWYAYREHLNITLISVWGIVNAVHALCDILSGVFSMIYSLVTLNLSNMLLVVAVPLVELIAAVLAWELVMHHDANGGDVAHILKGDFTGYSSVAAPKALFKNGDTQRTLTAAAQRLASLAQFKKKDKDPFLDVEPSRESVSHSLGPEQGRDA